MLFNYIPWIRERGWQEITAELYSQIWAQYGGSVATHPSIIQKLSNLADINVRYLGWYHNKELVGAIACWGQYLALSRDCLKKQKKRDLFDLGNAEIILPLAQRSKVTVRHKTRYLSVLNKSHVNNWCGQKEQLAMARPMDEYSKKFRYNQRRELRLLEEAGGEVQPILNFSSEQLAHIYCDLFSKRWGFEIATPEQQAKVFTLLREFMTGSIILLNENPIAIQVLYRVESPHWVSIEYVNGGVDPQERTFSPGSVLSFINLQNAWDDAKSRQKDLRYSFGRADREYKDRWCNRVDTGKIS